MDTTGTRYTLTDWTLGFAAIAIATVAVMSVVTASGLPMMEWGVLLIGAAFALQAIAALNRRWRSR